jgi:3'(2'), 5'-bisphosphate nucleotidase
MDTAYCSKVIRDFVVCQGHVPLIDHNPRGGEKIEFAPHEALPYNIRTGAERSNARLKDEFGARDVWVRGGRQGEEPPDVRRRRTVRRSTDAAIEVTPKPNTRRSSQAQRSIAHAARMWLMQKAGTPMHHLELLARIAAVAQEAGAAVMQVYAGDFQVRRKADHSPVTEADERAEALILERLAALTPGVPVISEEQAAAGRDAPAAARFWLVDPLDGTREFIQRNGEFTVNIALIEAGCATLGVVFAPALGRLYTGALGCGARTRDAAGERSIACRSAPPQGLTVVTSRSHGDGDALGRFLAGHKVVASTSAGSSLKFCLVAAGEADLYPRLGRTMEWDTAAGHAVLTAAGGRVATLDGAELRYGKPGLENPHFVASGWVATHTHAGRTAKEQG